MYVCILFFTMHVCMRYYNTGIERVHSGIKFYGQKFQNSFATVARALTKTNFKFSNIPNE